MVRFPLVLGSVVPVLGTLVGCGSSIGNLPVVDYTPLPGNDWAISTPSEQGLDPTMLDQLYSRAGGVETIEALLVIKNGYLIGEAYLHDGAVDKATRIQSVTKSFTSALVGIALERGCLSSLDQTMMDFFPELDDQITDPRKRQITLRQMLQFRAGYPWEESSRELFDMLYGGFRTRYLAEVPLVSDPGTKFDYSNLTAHLVGVIVARACGTDLKSFAEANLFGPIGAVVSDWIEDWEGNYNGHADLYLTARDMAKFGLLYLNDGEYDGTQVVPSSWVRASLRTYSQNAWYYGVGKHFADVGYGYMWWSVTAGEHRYHLAWGHGGQQIAVLDDSHMVIVVKADPLHGQHGGGPWKREKENLNLVADFIASLPK
jgi:CubicO group peptidase (beta-lactamase class C family)